jgi:membrane protease YdiL (CAAX protease family)
MKLYSSDQFTRALPQSMGARILQFPLARLVVAVLFLAPVLALDKVVKLKIISPLSGDTQIVIKYIEAVVFFALFLVAYRLYTKYVERRQATEVSVSGWFSESGRGFLISMGLVMAVVAVLFAAGYVDIAGLNANKRVALDLAVKFAMGAFIEELIFRLILFRLTEELLGTWMAFIIQAVFFGFAHQANENATVLTSISLIIVGGIFYTAAFMYTRRIWFPLGIHMGWNYLQSGIFSMPNSGSAYDGLIKTTVAGPAAMTGGSFGIEASYLAIALCLIAGTALTVAAGKGGQIIAPPWKKTPTVAAESCG